MQSRHNWKVFRLDWRTSPSQYTHRERERGGGGYISIACVTIASYIFFYRAQEVISEIKTRYNVYIFIVMVIVVVVCIVVVYSMAEVEDVYHKKGAELSEVVRPIREVNRRHQQVHVYIRITVAKPLPLHE